VSIYGLRVICKRSTTVAAPRFLPRKFAARSSSLVPRNAPRRTRTTPTKLLKDAIPVLIQWVSCRKLLKGSKVRVLTRLEVFPTAKIQVGHVFYEIEILARPSSFKLKLMDAVDYSLYLVTGRDLLPTGKVRLWSVLRY
jgi:hypothetical protein